MRGFRDRFLRADPPADRAPPVDLRLDFRLPWALRAALILRADPNSFLLRTPPPADLRLPKLMVLRPTDPPGADTTLLALPACCSAFLAAAKDAAAAFF